MAEDHNSLLDRLIRFCLEQKLVVVVTVLLLIGWGVAVAPFDWEMGGLRAEVDSVAVDAIPNLGENQQIVFTEWPGRSPQDIEDQVTYPLTVTLMGVPGVKEVRSRSMFGFSSIFVIFHDDVEFYWSRARLIEKLNALPSGLLPGEVQPALGPDATGMGQIFWYTLEGRSPDGEPTGGWDLHELRSVQDWFVRYGLTGAEGVSEVASIGGHVREYHVDVDPDAMRSHGVTMGQIAQAVGNSNVEVGARTTEINQVEYVIRGLGYVRGLDDIEKAVVRAAEGGVPIQVDDVANVTLGPAERRGALTMAGAEAVGGVVVVREGYNPLSAIQNVKAKIAEIEGGLPAKVLIDWTQTTREEVENFAALWGIEDFQGEAGVAWLRSNDRALWPEWASISQLEIVPFYDRTELIYETLGTLNDALVQQILVTMIVVIVLVVHLRASLVISGMLPMAVLICFIGMKLAGVEANVVALAGIAIAIGTIVDMGLIVSENVLRHLAEADDDEDRLEVVYRATREVGGAVLTAVGTTVVSFLPVFALTGAAGKMFTPLAFTKTFVLIAAAGLAITVVPAAAHVLIAGRVSNRAARQAVWVVLALAGLILAAVGAARGWAMVWPAGLGLMAIAGYHIAAGSLGERPGHAALKVGGWLANIVAAALVVWVLAWVWEPLGPERGLLQNAVFVILLIGSVLGSFALVMWWYGPILRWCLRHKLLFLSVPMIMVLAGLAVWLGFETMMLWGVPLAAVLVVLGFAYASWMLLLWSRDRLGVRFSLWAWRSVTAGWAMVVVLLLGAVVWSTAYLHENVDELRLGERWVAAAHAMPGLSYGDRVPFDEGSFLWMPTTSVHASIGEALDILKFQDQAIASIPEIEQVVGKIGRVDSAIDPAPVSMIETIVDYKSEYATDAAGRRVNFKVDSATGDFVRDEDGELIADPNGKPYRQWRDHIQSPTDIWEAMETAAAITGTTGASLLQPIETRQVMLQTGMRGSMGVKVRAGDLASLNQAVLAIEEVLRDVPGIRASTVQGERVVGKPYLEVETDRDAAARYGLNVGDVNNVVATGIGGRAVTRTVEGRARYDVRVRYPRELRNDVEAMERVLVDTPSGSPVQLGDVAEIVYRRGPQMIKSEDSFPVAYVTFATDGAASAMEVVPRAEKMLREQVAGGQLVLPSGVSFRFAGTYETQVAMMRKLTLIVPIALAIILLLLYFQFRSIVTTGIVFSGIAVAWAGGFITIYLYGQEWFGDFAVLGVNMRELFQLEAIALTGAVWVGFLALFGIAVDDGVVMSTYLKQTFDRRKPATIEAVREATVAAGSRRVRPCLMTSATTILALLPVLTATGRGADVMIPMAIPSVGGMSFVLITMFTVPVLYCLAAEIRLALGGLGADGADSAGDSPAL